MEFRHAHKQDAQEIADFMTRNFLATYGHSASAKNVAKAVHDYYGLDAQHADLADARIINYLCMIDNEIAGLAQVRPAKADSDTDPHRYELSRFYVEAAYHRKGIAPALMQNIQTLLIPLSAKSLWLSVWQEAAQAIRFYQKQGFVISGETTFMIGDEAAKDWLMTKNL
jgi:diamine N-acetyltransferase